MASNYEQITKDNIRRRGEDFDDIGNFMSQQLYSVKSHFVYELLQNAEDALERRFKYNPQSKLPNSVKFVLFEDRLEFRHFGQKFTEDNVRAISDVLKGTKNDDVNQIGKFGIGFKSVYAFTEKPEIHSGDEHFTIERYIRPKAIETYSNVANDETVFIFPFKNELSKDQTFDLILEKLKKLGSKTLLFLNYIDEIVWNADLTGENGQYLREVKNRDKAKQVTVIGHNNDQDEEETWLIFKRPVPIPKSKQSACVEVGFLIDTDAKDKKERIIRIINAPLVVYFPTETYTKFGFLIQGSYNTTPARDNIHKDDDWNINLIKETANLLVESLENLKEMGLLSVSLLEALPMNADVFFDPIINKVRDVLMEEELLPTNDKKNPFVSAKNAKLASAEWLRVLLQEEQLKQLFNVETNLKWISGEITETGKLRDIWYYIRDELKVEIVTPDSFARKINSIFLKKQDDDWMIKFYVQLGGQKALWKKKDWWGEGPLRSKEFIRLQDNTHVAPFSGDGAPNVYLTVVEHIETSLPIIKTGLMQNDDVYVFFNELGIPELDIVAEVIERILLKYQSHVIPLDEHRRDMEKILQAYKTDSHEKKQRLKKSLQSTAFILELTPEHREPVYRKPNELYFYNEELETYLHGNPNAGFISSEYEESTFNMFKDLGVSENVRVSKRSPDNKGFVIIKDSHGSHNRGLKGFDPEIQVEGLDHALILPSPEKSVFIWNCIAIPNSACIRGTIEKSSVQTYENIEKENLISKFGYLLIDKAWLPKPGGGYEIPEKLTLDDLPSGFEKDTPRAEALVWALKMRQPEHEQALELFTGRDPDRKKRVERFLSASDEEQEKMLKIFPHEIPNEPAPSFKDGLKKISRPQRGIIEHGDKEIFPISDPERYQDKLNKRVEEGVNEHQSKPHNIKFSLVKDNPSNLDARNFLYKEYLGRCQVTGKTFPKANRNVNGVAENYFEACCLISNANASYLNDAGNMLCVSADTMAKFKCASVTFLDNLEDVIETFKASEKAEVLLKIQLAGEECFIKWSQRHFKCLVALYEKA